jgi:hypothetical protein
MLTVIVGSDGGVVIPYGNAKKVFATMGSLGVELERKWDDVYVYDLAN